MFEDVKYVLDYYEVSYVIGDPRMYWTIGPHIEVGNSRYSFSGTAHHYAFINVYLYLMKKDDDRKILGNIIYNV